ncbi:MAG: GvpL/GvpF family gas vesicle protein [Stenomitos rutilans HA7619-LM2]|jgi:hypothetical protein|nr:GvpL/GvpF family gas vesicle protein [Stenomitos rutilans HA7619-LM2]
MYTYAFCKTPPAPLNLPHGIVALVQSIETGQLSALVEPAISLDALKQDDTLLMQAVLGHDRVIRDLFVQTTILPLRFGTSFNSLEGLKAHLYTQQQTYLNKLAQLEGKAEYTLKLIPQTLPELAIGSAIKGKDYFLAKKQQFQAQLLHQQQQQAAFKQIEQTITQTYRHCRLSEDQTGNKTLHLLLAYDREQQLRQTIQTLQAQHPEWQIALGGALPPYHFVDNTSESDSNQ